MEEQGFWILRALPREIREEVLSFHRGQYIEDCRKGIWKEQHAWKFRGCLAELIVLTQTVCAYLSTRIFSSVRFFSVEDNREYIHYNNRPYPKEWKITRSPFTHDPVTLIPYPRNTTVRGWIVNHLPSEPYGNVPRQLIRNLLNEIRNLDETEWKVWLNGSSVMLSQFQHL
jgi:hypothetical protein